MEYKYIASFKIRKSAASIFIDIMIDNGYSVQAVKCNEHKYNEQMIEVSVFKKIKSKR